MPDQEWINRSHGQKHRRTAEEMEQIKQRISTAESVALDSAKGYFDLKKENQSQQELIDQHDRDLRMLQAERRTQQGSINDWA